jgi:Asp-tRNA(Asn)/Glu-tRNA(Gln) amidotransferase B subunit
LREDARRSIKKEQEEAVDRTGMIGQDKMRWDNRNSYTFAQKKPDKKPDVTSTPEHDYF